MITEFIPAASFAYTMKILGGVLSGELNEEGQQRLNLDQDQANFDRERDEARRRAEADRDGAPEEEEGNDQEQPLVDPAAAH